MSYKYISILEKLGFYNFTESLGIISCCHRFITIPIRLVVKYVNIEDRAFLHKDTLETYFDHDMRIYVFANYDKLKVYLSVMDETILSLYEKKILVINEEYDIGFINNIININNYGITHKNGLESYIGRKENINNLEECPIYRKNFKDPILEFGNYHIYIWILLEISGLSYNKDSFIVVYNGEDYLLVSSYDNEN